MTFWLLRINWTHFWCQICMYISRMNFCRDYINCRLWLKQQVKTWYCNLNVTARFTHACTFDMMIYYKKLLTRTSSGSWSTQEMTKQYYYTRKPDNCHCQNNFIVSPSHVPSSVTFTICKLGQQMLRQNCKFTHELVANTSIKANCK